MQEIVSIKSKSSTASSTRENLFSREYSLTLFITIYFGNFIAEAQVLKYGYALAKALIKYQMEFRSVRCKCSQFVVFIRT